MVRGMIRTGLGLAAVSMLALIVSESEMGGDHRSFLRKGLFVGAALCTGGVAISFLTELWSFARSKRCPACHRPVRKGHVYCEDHFREALYRSRDKVGVR